MKKVKLYCAAALVSLLTFFSTPSVLSLGTLKEVSTPYVGEYHCTQLRIGKREFPTDGVRLVLDGDGGAKLWWKNMLGKEQSSAYSYVYDAEEGILLVGVPIGKEEKIFKIYYDKGELIVAESLTGKGFFAKFSKKR